MSGLENMKRQILDEANHSAEEQISKARTKAEEILREAREQMEEQSAVMAKKSEDETKDYAQRIASSSEMQRKPNKQDLRKEEILKFCIEPKSLFDIMQHVNLKARKNVMNVYINPMLAAGVLKMTEPDNPTSRNQMYVTAEEAPEHGEA